MGTFSPLSRGTFTPKISRGTFTPLGCNLQEDKPNNLERVNYNTHEAREEDKPVRRIRRQKEAEEQIKPPFLPLQKQAGKPQKEK